MKLLNQLGVVVVVVGMQHHIVSLTLIANQNPTKSVEVQFMLIKDLFHEVNIRRQKKGLPDMEEGEFIVELSELQIKGLVRINNGYAYKASKGNQVEEEGK